jgi:hypothetical protein
VRKSQNLAEPGGNQIPGQRRPGPCPTGRSQLGYRLSIGSSARGATHAAGARQEAEKVNARIVLIDGDRLAELMVRHGVGVQTETTAVLHRVDEDFFDTLDEGRRFGKIIKEVVACGAAPDGQSSRIGSSLTPVGVMVSAHGPAPSFVACRSSRISCRVNIAAKSAGEWSCFPPIHTERRPCSR